MLLHLYSAPGLSLIERDILLRRVRQRVSSGIQEIETEYCFNIEITGGLEPDEWKRVGWLLRSASFGPETHLTGKGICFEVGPRLNFTTAWATHAVSILHACGLTKIRRIERSRRFLVKTTVPLRNAEQAAFVAEVHDRMTECPYPEPLTSFETGIKPEPVSEIPLLEQGRSALERINREMGLAFDEWDMVYYSNLFVDLLKRNPTNVEIFDIGQCNSEHSRHWFFKGRLIIDGQEVSASLLNLIRRPLQVAPGNSIIAFKDNSSAIRGYTTTTIIPQRPGEPAPFVESEVNYHIIFTAETHNFPTGVAPFPGAETGTGGRIRDDQTVGRGGLVVAGSAAYCVGNLSIPGYELPWENPHFPYPDNLATPRQILIEASNGASDYGNKFGEPVILGFARSFGLRLPSGERREWVKPIMFTGGIGQLDARHTEKGEPEAEMLVVKIGGPAYRIGIGGGAASSMVQGENVAELDFNAVQRGDAEMEQKVNRVIRACVELGDSNPIVSIHDQGAGGNCNVLQELIDPAGAQINVRAIPLGDETLSVLEIWGAEYQEQNALLLRPEDRDMFAALCQREKVPVAFVGEITGTGKIILYDEDNDSTPVDLPLDKILGDMPQKTFALQRIPPLLEPLRLPQRLTLREALERVLRLVAVGSKRFLTTKVDRSVTGLIARQQCVGPLQITLGDVAVIAQNHFGMTGAATAIGEQPLKGLIHPAAMARMSVGEALTNLVWALVSDLRDVKCSGNWMWAAKLPGEGAALHEAAEAVCDIMIQLGIAIDGGKDSLSMAAYVPGEDGADEVVKAPGEFTVSAYVTCPDVTKIVTPDFKRPGRSRILYVDLGCGQHRLGGSALAQVFEQIGDTVPDVDDPERLKRAFNVVQNLIAAELVVAGHDRSDGGLITTLLEMAFAGNCGFEVQLVGSGDPMAELFAEELGLVLEVQEEDMERVVALFGASDVPCMAIGRTLSSKLVRIDVGGEPVLEEDLRDLRDLWEETGFQLDRLQANPDCVEQEQRGLRERIGPRFSFPYAAEPTARAVLEAEEKPRIAILREEGSNGDREMTSAFYAAGFETWDVTMSDLLAGRITLDRFRGIAFVGGFSYADVLDAGRGWAGVIRFNAMLSQQFQDFYERPDTFSLGVCNGCQLMALLGWVPWQEMDNQIQVRFIHNVSGRFESRFVTVQIGESPAIMLQGMAGAQLGIWVAHAEGQASFSDRQVFARVIEDHLAPIRYVDDQGRVTEAYPFNPNGSPAGIAALCSPDGRHLAVMPHPERTFLPWQWPWMPEKWQRTLKASPWLKMFQNARVWCERDK